MISLLFFPHQSDDYLLTRYLSLLSQKIGPTEQCPVRTGILCNGGQLVLWKVQLNLCQKKRKRKVQFNWESGGFETGPFKKTTDFNWQPFWEGFLPGWIVKHVDFIRFDSSKAGYHLVLGFRLSARYGLVAVWWMMNKRSFCFIIAFHNFATLENRLTYQCQSSWPVVITMKKKLAGTWKKI